MNENTIIKSPEYVLEKVKKYFTKERKSIFFWTIILGLITHFLLLTNLIMSQDGLLMGIHYTAGLYEASLGRWGINWIDSIRNNIALPFITTLISILIMGFINILLIELFEIKSPIFKFFTILSVVASPGLCMTLLYVYTADAYIFAMLFSVFSAYSLYKIKPKKIAIFLSIISFVLTLSIYQSYMGITIGIIAMLSVKKILSQENKIFEIVKDIVEKALIIFVSALIYFITTKIILKIKGIQMSGYGGLNKISPITIFSTLIPSLKNAYIGFLKYYFADGIIFNRIWGRDKLYLVFFGLFGLSLFFLFIAEMKNKKILKEVIIRFVFSILIICLLPIVLNLVVILAPGNEIYYLTSTQMMLMFPFVFTIFELITNQENIKNIIKWCISSVSFLILSSYVLTCIVTYQTLELSYNQAKTMLNRVFKEMEECENYEYDMPVLFAGVIDDYKFTKTLDLYNYSINNILKISIFHGTYQGLQGTWRNFSNLFFGKDLNFCEDFQYYKIVNSDEFKEMNIFPGKDSIKIISGIMVVKFTDEPQLPPYSENMMLNGITPY